MSFSRMASHSDTYREVFITFVFQSFTGRTESGRSEYFANVGRNVLQVFLSESESVVILNGKITSTSLSIGEEIDCIAGYKY